MRFSKKNITLAPTDLSNFLGCRHLTSLDLAALKAGEKRPARYGPMIDALRERGIAHEKAYLEQLRSEGLSISEGGDEEPTTQTIGRTEKAMADGIDTPPFFGAWCCNSDSGTLSFVGFWPNLMYQFGTVANIAFWCFSRSRIARQVIGNR